MEYDFKNNKIYRYSDGLNNSVFKFLKFKKKYVRLLSRENFNAMSSTLTIYDEVEFKKQFLIGESDLIIKSVPSQGLPYLSFTLILLTF